MTQVTFDLVEFQHPIEDYIDHAQAALETLSVKHATRGVVAAGAALALANMVIPRVAGNELTRFSEYRRQAQALLVSFWGEFGLVLLRQSHSEQQVVVHAQPATVSTKPILHSNGKRGGVRATISAEIREKVVRELEAGPGVDKVGRSNGIEEWLTLISNEYGIGVSTLFNWRTKLKKGQRP